MLTESRYTAMGTSLGQSDPIAVSMALTLPASPSPSALTRCHLSQRERQRISQAQHLLAVSGKAPSPSTLASGARLRGRDSAAAGCRNPELSKPAALTERAYSKQKRPTAPFGAMDLKIQLLQFQCVSLTRTQWIISGTYVPRGPRCRPGCRTPGTRPRPARRPAAPRTSEDWQRP